LRAIINNIGIRNKIPCSSFYIDKNYKLKQFQIDPGSELSDFLKQAPTLHCKVEEIINRKYKAKFLIFLNTCLTGCSLSFEVRVRLEKERNLFFQIIFTPIYNGKNTYALCTVIDYCYKLNHLNIFDDYSDFTSTQLRTSATQMLSLINLMDIKQLGSLELEKISRLLSDVNLQTHKLDDLIKSLRFLVKKDEVYDFPLPAPDLMEKIRNIVILNNEASGNTDHKILKKFFDPKIITSFENPDEAFNYIVDIRPDLIFLDSELLNTDGFQLLQKLELQALNIDVVLISSLSDPESMLRTRLYKNVRGSIDKPLTIEKLREVFKTYH